jgi:heme/copper-type cytochrome/quinol oxidase subunit 2
MGRELCKFFAGFLAAMAVGHAMYAIFVSSGWIKNEPVWLGRTWGVGYAWTEAPIYLGISLVLAYFAWFRRKPQKALQEPKELP